LVGSARLTYLLQVIEASWFFDDQLALLSREELIAAVKVLRSRVVRPRERAGDAATSKAFVAEDYSVRRIALRVAYQGWDFKGVALQDHTTETIEGELFRALEVARLIDSPKTCNFSRSGRTDKGVSAFEQVFALDVRSQCAATDVSGDGFVRAAPPTSRKLRANEMDYASLLNRVLPSTIAVTGWAPVSLAFDARFSTLYRTYRYYFFDRSRLDLQRMRVAARHFVGEHDFRNFCKHDPSVESSVRTIIAFDVRALEQTAHAPHRGRLCELRVRGFAFLWHQVRNMAAVLFAVGEGLEEPDIVRDMLDVGRLPDKPVYEMASDAPLVLHEAAYDGIAWRDDASKAVVAALIDQAEQAAVRLAVLDGFIESLPERALAHYRATSLQALQKHKPLLTRRRELSQAGKQQKTVKHAVKRAFVGGAAASASSAEAVAASPPPTEIGKKQRREEDADDEEERKAQL